MTQPKIAFIGAGNMANAILTGLVKNGYPAQKLTATAPSDTNLAKLRQQLAINTTHNNVEAAQNADVIVLAVKPQGLQSVCESLPDLSGKLVLSIAAGVTLERLSQWLNGHTNLVRAMPNTPALIGMGMTGLFAHNDVSETDKTFIDTQLQSVGKTCWVETEAQMNGIIAAAGSAPAYFFLFMQAMQEEAMKQGFTEAQARQLVEQTALGASQLVQVRSDCSLAELRAQVTSKGGTTAEAIRVFEREQLNDTVGKAMRAAVARAEEMERLF